MSLPPKDVYIGMWTDWSKDSQVLGSTITITTSASRLLGAFLALFISLSVSYLWLLVVYSIHQARYAITTGNCRAIVRQQQALLKAGLSPTSTSIRLIKLYWAYRYTPFAWQQSWLWISISVVSAVSGVAAGLFSSRIIDSSLYFNILTDSSNCGFFLEDFHIQSNIDDPMVIALEQDEAATIGLAATYARNCYNTTGDNSQCNFFPSTTIPWETEWEAECPFEGICIGPAMRLDTGLLNSNSLLGINSPNIDQIEVRKITTCAPLRQEGYTETEPGPVPEDGLTSYLYGPSPDNNVTFTASNDTRYSTLSYTSYGVWANRSQWQPIRELNNTHGDGTVFCISSNNLYFLEPCDDPVFSAHAPTYVLNYSSAVYLADNPAGVLGCLEQIKTPQYQVCSTASNICSAVGGLGDVYLEATEGLSLTPMQLITIRLIVFVIDRLGNIADVTDGQTPNLQASQRTVVGFQLPLPRNQWQVEIQAWHAATMALIQYGILEYMTGPWDAGFQKYVTPPTSPEQNALCKRQRVRISQGFANVSSLGLFFTISLGTVIIIFALFIDNITGCVTRLSKGGGKKHRAWIRDDVLHLQRLAYGPQQFLGPRWIAADDNTPYFEGNGFLDPIVDPQDAETDETYKRLSIDSLMETGEARIEFRN
ncbi:hypothetical protein O1611_g3064 [Lasiodiplodia mahajangana]|uniref:Uncharacterized protein n=1 Tax=Lasiodiplodia mahajangana TaxID=1108764 RepID=A0ACC2JT99_9PEZI|nr:hypothetical protein O1611_g3064 [Lasiodiplodia mahajangana]